VDETYIKLKGRPYVQWKYQSFGMSYDRYMAPRRANPREKLEHQCPVCPQESRLAHTSHPSFVKSEAKQSLLLLTGEYQTM
jgi:hypothetical protein